MEAQVNHRQSPRPDMVVVGLPEAAVKDSATLPAPRLVCYK